MPIITLLTDFGIEDEYVGIMKGVMLSVNPSLSIVDISHQIRPQDLTQAAFVVQSMYRFFPAGTIHLVVVDPGVGSGRDIIALKLEKQLFIAPDNGVLTLLFERADRPTIRRVMNSDLYLKPVSHTFHGRDIFAPVAAHLSRGFELERLGPPVDRARLIHLDIPQPHLSRGGELVGTIVSVDGFGNLITNIKKEQVENFCSENESGKILVKAGEVHMAGISESYMEVPPNEPLAIMGSRGYLELAVNRGSAAAYFRQGIGAAVRLKRPG